MNYICVCPIRDFGNKCLHPVMFQIGNTKFVPYQEYILLYNGNLETGI